ncbi:MAG: exosortase/archaeosortase family protein [Caldilineae bacterium]|nr:MAG: exosortase/archaeosortase family protein [Caldilineae bacterium]
MFTHLRRTDAILYALITLLATLVLLPTLRWLINEWWSNDYYSHGILVPLVSVFFAYRLLPSVERKPSNLGLLLLVAALVIYLIALFQRAFFVAALGMIGLFAGLVWYFWGVVALKRLAFPLAFLVFMVPLPFVEGSSLPLSLLTGQLSTGVMQAAGMDVTVKGAEVTLPNANLVVGAQCSGLRSIVALFTLVAVFAYIVEGAWPAKVLLFLSAAPIAILGNIFRVSSLLWVADRWGVDAGFKYYHDYSGIFFFLFAFACLILLARILGCKNVRGDLL